MAKSHRAIGIDPGEKGAAAFLKYSSAKGWQVEKIIDFSVILCSSTTGKAQRTEPNYKAMCAMFDEIKAFSPHTVTVEWQQTWGTDSSRSGFALGGWYIALRLGLEMIGIEPITPDPKTWKAWDEYKPFGLYGARDQGKAVGIDICGKLWPDRFNELFCPLWKGSKTRRRKPHDGRTDSALIGLYGAIEHGKAPMFSVQDWGFVYGVPELPEVELDDAPIGELISF